MFGRLQGAKLAAAHRGELRSPLAVGYVYDDGEVVIDPDEQIRQAVEDLFAEFAATGSAMGVVKAFAATGRLFPQRKWGGAWDGQIKWGRLTHSPVLQAAKNPVYAGAYAYGRSYDTRTVREDGTVAATKVKRARADWTVLIQNHHPGYITWQQFLDIEAKLAANHTKAGFRPPRGEGSALCQGIMFCGTCGGRMGTQYGPAAAARTRRSARPGRRPDQTVAAPGYPGPGPQAAAAHPDRRSHPAARGAHRRGPHRRALAHRRR